MTHDPMCPDAGEHFVSRDRYGNSMSCMCPEYARVRADERRAQYDAQSDNWIKEFSERVRADERERAAERVAAALAEFIRTYADYAERGEEVPRIYPAVAPRTLTADDPEPSVGSVVLDRLGGAWQRLMAEGWHVAGWIDPRPWSYVYANGPVALIHDGGKEED